MDDYREMYYILFNRISDIIKELQALQQQAEEAYLAGPPGTGAAGLAEAEQAPPAQDRTLPFGRVRPAARKTMYGAK